MLRLLSGYVMVFRGLIFLLLSLAFLGGCAGKAPNPIEYAKKKVLYNDSDGKPIEEPEVLYERGMGLIAKKQYNEAIKAMDELGELYPFSKLAQQATVMSAYLNYLQGNYTVTEATTEHFIDAYSWYEHLSYIYYLRAMAQYQQIRSVSHDHAISAKAYSSMLALVARFPNSVYARDVEDRMLLTQYYLAAKDIDVGRFYMKNRQFLPAMMRFNKYLQEYPNTFYTPEALYRLVVCSELLSLELERQKYYLLLTYNFPYSYWRKEADRFLHARTTKPNTHKLISHS